MTNGKADSVDDFARSAFAKPFKSGRSGRRLIVGVNFKPQTGAADQSLSFALCSTIADEAIAELRRVKARRDADRVEQALKAVRDAAKQGTNTMPALIEAVRARASIGEMTQSLASVFGRHASSIERDIVSMPRGNGNACA